MSNKYIIPGPANAPQCRYCQYVRPGLDTECANSLNIVPGAINVLNGAEIYNFTLYEVRSNVVLCGPEGKWYKKYGGDLPAFVSTSPKVAAIQSRGKPSIDEL